jgi:hypothetical protein
MVNWKLPAGAGAVGAVISLAAGFASGHAFGTVLLRALVSALIGGGLGFAVQSVLRRFLPELGTREPAEPPGAVDILIDEEIPLAAPAEGAEEPAGGSAAMEELGDAEALPGGPPLREPGEAAGQPALDSAAEPLEAGYPFSTDLEAAPAEELPAAPGEAEPGGLEGGLESLGPAGEGAAGLEGLSELDAIGPSTTSSRSQKAEELEARKSSLVKGQTPESLAKAVRSFMRKDQEG